MARIPAAEVDVTPDLVRTLLERQHPDLLTGREIAMFANGWDNAMLRLGDDLLVRLPRRELAAQLVEHEQAWLPLLAPQLPVPVPTPIRTGSADAGYPWSWSVVPWQHGRMLGAPDGDPRPRVATALGAFLAALHVAAPAEVWSSPYRGGSLGPREHLVTERLARYAGTDAARLLDRWRADVAPPEPVGPRLWAHGDLHPLNLLVDDDRLVAVIDWGDVTAGDPACDLAIAWLGLDATDADTLRACYDDAATHHLDLDRLWSRARGWALHLALVMLDGSDDSPALHAVGRHALARLTATPR